MYKLVCVCMYMYLYRYIPYVVGLFEQRHHPTVLFNNERSHHMIGSPLLDLWT